MQRTLKTFSRLPVQRRLISLAVAGACATLSIAQAQEAASPTDSTTNAPTVVVTGIRASLQSTLNMKRNSDGIVDGIVADDIGKFPDTNLAESLQRISGVSIDRSNGEGQKVTVRGLGPDFNLVLLNGRQMPTTDLSDLSGRSFDFSNLASEAISQLQVYKTGRADTPSGGIGATINVMTARPLDNPGMRASIGAKAVKDTSNDHLPGMLKGDSVTPEVSGIYSNTSADGRFGVAVSASYQKRDSGFNRAGLANGYQGPYLGSDTTAGVTLPQPGQPGSQNITNRPGQTDLYSIPQNFGYGVNAIERERTNGQLVLQFRPVKELTTTLDLTYSEQKIHTRRNELSVWFGQTPTSTSTWPSGHVVSPLTYQEVYQTPQDISVVGGDYATKTKNQSIGFNALWKASSELRVEFDAHHSTAESGADSPFGSENNLSNASFSRGTTKIDFTHELPVLSMPAADLANQPIQAAGSWFHNSWQKATINQAQAKGNLKLMESSDLSFGASYTDSTNRSTFSNVQNNTWGGATKASDYPAGIFQANPLGSFFNQLGGHDAPELFGSLYTFDFAKLRALTAQVTGNAAGYLPNFASADTDRELKEKTTSGYLSFNTDWDSKIPFHSSIGVRLERTKVTSVAQVLPGTAVVWVSQNELPITFAGNSYSTQDAKYTNVLPSLNLDFDLRSDMKLRASAGATIGRPRYDQLQGGLTLGTIGNVFTGGTASVGNPALKPVKSKNLDLSWEWYYDQQSVLSLAGFHKQMDNYAGQTVVSQNLYNLHTPVGGAYYNAALASGCSTADTNCIRNYILGNYNGQPGVQMTGVKSDGNLNGNITGLPTDPLMNFLTTTYANQKSATVKGAELNVQHMFGHSGFGVQANYTYVTSPTKYDNANTNDQFAILGLSNSANVVGIYEDSKWSVRVAYNWRDKFLAATVDGGGRAAPVYTDKYGQTDVSIGYNYNQNLSFQAEVINLTNATQRQFGRTEASTLNVTQAGPRYMLGARYKF
ncbi:TonB-dependent receptor [Duganella dendranthematis]|uniref:TonB-dependent receptor n=1 Tax=Duganella dendranthematis TaxID=2728021 RepID=A0ABX6MA37_9BURK|nr:TonB-dependent receptor [Duganella dendranthematis]QJD90946.1 TonB-dependent receptor [Duganella dendranthematis]